MTSMEHHEADREGQVDDAPRSEPGFLRPPGDPLRDVVDASHEPDSVSHDLSAKPGQPELEPLQVDVPDPVEPAADAPAWAQVEPADPTPQLDVELPAPELVTEESIEPEPSEPESPEPPVDEGAGQAAEPAARANAEPSSTEDSSMFDVPLGTLVYRSGLLDAAQIEAALEESERHGKRLGEVLVEGGLIAERDLGRLLAGQKGLPFVDLSPAEIDPAAAELLPAASARIYCAVPIRVEGGVPLVAVSDPTNGLVVEGVKRALGGDLNFAVAARGDLQTVIAAVYGSDEEELAPVEHLSGPSGQVPAAAGAESDVVPLGLTPTEAAPEQPPALTPVPTDLPPPSKTEAPMTHAAEATPPDSTTLPLQAADAPAPVGGATRIVVQLADGERIEAGSYVDMAEATARARELISNLDARDPGQWPLIAGRFVRPDSILTVDLLEDRPRY